jgi:YHS domain-containing protein
VNQSYWVRFDTGEIYFCSKECALNYRTNSNQILN